VRLQREVGPRVVDLAALQHAVVERRRVAVAQEVPLDLDALAPLARDPVAAVVGRLRGLVGERLAARLELEGARLQRVAADLARVVVPPELQARLGVRGERLVDALAHGPQCPWPMYRSTRPAALPLFMGSRQRRCDKSR
jgi:hypothetical protein